ncbi:hypothetical protein [Parasitella parasitica]|uniref:Uncharacterized protein n=1 Tax=Parasitella parasitica TaxID=35722 RepID=A0A0B7N100_9FUNG|nr:hypothetical protein [Parasitella parasitica]
MCQQHGLQIFQGYQDSQGSEGIISFHLSMSWGNGENYFKQASLQIICPTDLSRSQNATLISGTLVVFMVLFLI